MSIQGMWVSIHDVPRPSILILVMVQPHPSPICRVTTREQQKQLERGPRSGWGVVFRWRFNKLSLLCRHGLVSPLARGVADTDGSSSSGKQKLLLLWRPEAFIIGSGRAGSGG